MINVRATLLREAAVDTRRAGISRSEGIINREVRFPIATTGVGPVMFAIEACLS